MNFPFGQPAVLHSVTSTTRDGDGNTVPVYTDTTINGCAFDPGGSVELVQGQDMVTTQPTLYLPSGAELPEAIDQVTVAGGRYDVDGSPNLYSNPFTGWKPGAVVKLKAVTG